MKNWLFDCDVIQCQRPSYGKCSISHCDAALVLFYLSNLSQVECPPVLDSDKRSIVISLGLSSKGIPAQFYFRDSFYVYCLPIFLCLIIYLSNVMLLLQIKVLELHMIDTLNLLDALIVRESFRMRLTTLIEILKYLKIKIITSVLKRNTFWIFISNSWDEDRRSVTSTILKA